VVGAYSAELVLAKLGIDIAKPLLIEKGTALVLGQYETAVADVISQSFAEFAADAFVVKSGIAVNIYFPALTAAIAAIPCYTAEIAAVFGYSVYHIVPPL
jgi:hypothetical protein